MKIISQSTEVNPQETSGITSADVEVWDGNNTQSGNVSSLTGVIEIRVRLIHNLSIYHSNEFSSSPAFNRQKPSFLLLCH